MGFGISNGLENFEGETIKKIATLSAQTEASIREETRNGENVYCLIQG